RGSVEPPCRRAQDPVVSSRSGGGRRAARRPPSRDSGARKCSGAFARAAAVALRARETPVLSQVNRRDRDKPHSSASLHSEVATANHTEPFLRGRSRACAGPSTPFLQPVSTLRRNRQVREGGRRRGS